MDAELEKRLQELESRLSYQEKFHKNLTPEGNLKHTLSVVPLLVISTAMGMFLGYNFYNLLKK
jgi:hypothetical protein